MKALKFLPFLIIGVITSCSSDSDDNSSSSPSTPFSLSLENGNYWVYDINTATGTTRDSLYIANDTVIGANTYKKFKTKDIPTGFYSTSLNNNGVRKSNSKLLLSGTLEVGANQGLPSDITIDLSDFIIFDASANEGNNLDTFSSSFQETIGGFPLTINYTLKSKAGESYSEYTTNGSTYNNVKSTVITLNLTVSTTFPGLPTPIIVLNNQEVLNSKQYVAENVGVVNTSTVFSYEIDPAIATQIGIPSSTTQNQEEFLDTYNVE